MADPFSQALVGFLLSAGGAAMGSQAIAMMGLQFYMSSLSSLISGKPKSQEPTRTPVTLGNLSSSGEPYHVIYGKTRIGAVRIFVGAAGTANKYLNVVYTLSHGDCEGLDSDGDGDIIWLDDKRKSYYETYSGIDLFDYAFHSLWVCDHVRADISTIKRDAFCQF